MNDSDFIHAFVKGTSSSLTLLLLHGTGGDENQMLPLGRRLAPEASMISPRGKVSENGMPRFFRRFAEGVLDVDDLKARTHELVQFLARASQTYSFDGSSLLAVGYSNGANIAASVMLLYPSVLTGAVLFRPMVPFRPPSVPDLSGRCALVLAGEWDGMVPKNQTEELVALFQQAGASAQVHWAKSGHGMIEEEVEYASRWIGSRVWGDPRNAYLGEKNRED